MKRCSLSLWLLCTGVQLPAHGFGQDVGGPIAPSTVDAAPSPALEATAEAVPAGPSQASLPAAVTTWLGAQRDEQGGSCELHAVLSAEGVHHLACGPAGVWSLQLRRDDSGPQLLRRQRLAGSVRGLFVHNGTLWAEIESVRAEPITPLPSTPSSPVPRPEVQGGTAAGPSVSAGVRGELFERDENKLTFVFPEAHNLVSGNRLQLQTAQGEVTRPVVVGEVESVRGARVVVRIGTNETVPVQATAVPSESEPTRSVVAPPRAGDLWHVGFLARPFLAMNELGGGALVEAWAGRRFAGPLHLQARMAPLGFAKGEGSAVWPAAGYLMASYDLPLFELGLGAGAGTHLDGDAGAAGSGADLVQHIRLGAVDGFNLSADSHILVYDRRFNFSAMFARLQVPLGARTWLIAGGGGGEIGTAHGELGLRSLLVGNGEAGSIFVTAVIGGVALHEDTFECDDRGTCSGENVTYGGPMLGAGAEFRL